MNVIVTYIILYILFFIDYNIVKAKEFHDGILRSSNKQETNESTVHLTEGTNVSQQDQNNSNGFHIIGGKKYFIQKFTPIKLRHNERTNGGIRKHNNGNYTTCETPNKDSGNCTHLNDCPILHRVQNRKENKQFLSNSICSQKGLTKYCCGKYENYRHLLPKRPLPKSCGYDSLNPIKKGRIFGGTETKLGEFPWLARILHTNSDGEQSVGCEGFLIHKRFILTAAHCVKSPRMALIGNITEIQLGEHNTQTEKDCNGLKCADPLQTMKVKSVISHPEYRHNSRDHHYDIALIYLKGEVKFSDYVQPICLSEKSTIPEAYWISGWGKTENGTYSNVKMKVSIPPFDITACNVLYARLRATVGQSQICAGGEANKDSCVGDSGGPLMFHNNESRWFAVGLVSYGINCGTEGWPGVYTSIPFYYNWIVDQISELRLPISLKHPVNSKDLKI
ncbi:hypothetical protein HHI36_012107 [Cryptolaemus montrouzieri]|uniref:CLIP domain-containing serine protease n=1 Tax=Cryptolaemus montrouzieri TaxID=559131 RepID=A0ABD2NDM3_9CUCU